MENQLQIVSLKDFFIHYAQKHLKDNKTAEEETKVIFEIRDSIQNYSTLVKREVASCLVKCGAFTHIRSVEDMFAMFCSKESNIEIKLEKLPQQKETIMRRDMILKMLAMFYVLKINNIKFPKIESEIFAVSFLEFEHIILELLYSENINTNIFDQIEEDEKLIVLDYVMSFENMLESNMNQFKKITKTLMNQYITTLTSFKEHWEKSYIFSDIMRFQREFYENTI